MQINFPRLRNLGANSKHARIECTKTNKIESSTLSWRTRFNGVEKSRYIYYITTHSLEREIGKIGKRMNGKRNFIEEEDRRGRRASKKNSPLLNKI
jgi:hypothetical protein